MMATTKSDNFWAGAAVGAYPRWVHIDSGNIGRTIITPRSNNRLVLCNATINTSGSSGITTLTDSLRGIIANLKSGVAEKDYHYQLPLTWNAKLYVDNSSASDLTIVFINY